MIVVCVALVAPGCGGGDSSTKSTGASEAPTTVAVDGSEKTKPKVTVPKGPPPKKLEIKDLEVGSGAEAKAGDEPTVHYVGVTYKDGKEFVSSWRQQEPMTFPLGEELVIRGWDQAVEGMKVGGRRELIIPPQLAYGQKGAPPTIGPNETLLYVIDLLAVK